MITFIGAASADGSSVAIPTHQAGDLLFFGSFRDGSNSTPTKPADITQLDTNTTNSAGALYGYKIAASSSETSGTWTNATEVSVLVHRGVDQVNPVGDHQPGTNVGTTLSFTALSLAVGDGTSWIASFAYHRSVDCNLGTVPTGMTLRLNQQNGSDEMGSYDTNAGVSSWSLQTTSVGGTSSGWATETIEIRAAADATTTSTSSTSSSTSTSVSTSTSSTSSSVSTSISSTSQSTSVSTSTSSTSSSTSKSTSTSSTSQSTSVSTSSTSQSTSLSTSTSISSTSSSTTVSLTTSTSSTSASTSVSTSSTSSSISTSISTSSTSKSTSTSSTSTSLSTSISTSTSSTSQSTSISTSISTSTTNSTVTTTSTSSTSSSISSTSTSLSTTTTLAPDPRSVPHFTLRNRL